VVALEPIGGKAAEMLPDLAPNDRSTPVFDEAASRALADAYLLILDVRRRRLLAPQSRPVESATLPPLTPREVIATGIDAAGRSRSADEAA
jgi:hypothetical protein